MLEKRVMVYLNTGAEREHVIVAKDDDDYLKQMNYYVDVMKGEQGSILGFDTPLCIYKIQNIVAIEFLDPPPPSAKIAMGFIPKKQ